MPLANDRPTTVYEKRQLDKRKWEAYRRAAAERLGIPYEPLGNVAFTEDGAFVEVNVFVPFADIEEKLKEPLSDITR